ncbi:hypothetical protein PIB30_075259 [Stylosanthes scabra]|uniref:Zinc finger GRF-type domain-containing protein n=1 Tax=Stylosanthes scabra TaxID=79078 RepID=A0ABU6ZP76_9FABA|nr:hypothetical protein [Stylosanthes scabra]
MDRKGHTSETRSRSLEEYSVGRDSRTCTVSSDSVGQPRKKKFSSPRCHYGSYAIIFQSCTKLNPDRFFLGFPNYNTSQQHCKYFYWLDMLVKENIEEAGSDRNDIFMARRLKELEQRVMEMDMELKFRGKNDARGGLNPGVGIKVKCCSSFGLALDVVGGLTIGCFMRNLAGSG